MAPYYLANSFDPWQILDDRHQRASIAGEECSIIPNAREHTAKANTHHRDGKTQKKRETRDQERKGAKKNEEQEQDVVNVKLFEVLLGRCLTPGSCCFCHAIINFSSSSSFLIHGKAYGISEDVRASDTPMKYSWPNLRSPAAHVCHSLPSMHHAVGRRRVLYLKVWCLSMRCTVVLIAIPNTNPPSN